MSKEVWRRVRISGISAEVSNAGRVRDIKNGIPPTYGVDNGLGYMRVRIGGVNYLVHRLIAGAFLPNPKKKRCVNHKNGVGFDNSLSNLEWATDYENIMHRFKELDKNRNAVNDLKVKCLFKIFSEPIKTSYEYQKYESRLIRYWAGNDGGLLFMYSVLGKGRAVAFARSRELLYYFRLAYSEAENIQGIAIHENVDITIHPNKTVTVKEKK